MEKERKEKRRRGEEREDREQMEGIGEEMGKEKDKERKKRKESKKEKKKASTRHQFLRSLIHVPELEDQQQQSFKAKDDSISIAETKESTEENQLPSPASVPAPAAGLPIAATSKSDFFAKLFAKEKLAPPVGTFHATGKKSDESHAPHESTTDWLCPKCNTSNYRHSHQCQKCKAVKRLSAWR